MHATAGHHNFADAEIEVKSTAHSHTAKQLRNQRSHTGRLLLNTNSSPPLGRSQQVDLEHRPPLLLSVRLQLRPHRQRDSIAT